MYDINRFIEAQEKDYSTALKEIKNGKKVSHWIWYIFPQLGELGYSKYSKYYGINSLEEAKEYYSNDYLRNHLIEISKALLENDNSALNICGSIDSLKVKSCMTLFEVVDPNEKIFKDVLHKFYNDERDNKTLEIIK